MIDQFTVQKSIIDIINEGQNASEVNWALVIGLAQEAQGFQKRMKRVENKRVKAYFNERVKTLYEILDEGAATFLINGDTTQNDIEEWAQGSIEFPTEEAMEAFGFVTMERYSEFLVNVTLDAEAISALIASKVNMRLIRQDHPLPTANVI